MRSSVLGLALFTIFACTPPAEPTAPTPASQPACNERIGDPRVEEVADGIFVAIGYDLANVILVQTPKGNVLIDAAMSRPRAARAKAALLSRAPGAVVALIYTHSHIDHTGGAAELVAPETEIWATAAFTQSLLKQYGLFQPTEARRGARQFGRHLQGDEPCSALGLRVDFEGARRTGLRLPTRQFTGTQVLDFGRRLELVEAHGETEDHLFVWVPDVSTLMAGDNYYDAFPNLYTLRGTRPRPVDDWIRSLDRMRERRPKVLVPSHTRPLVGAEQVEAHLRDYRDAIQWVRDEVVRRTNDGGHIDDIVSTLRLPSHLAERSFLAELYGRVDWSARAIYQGQLGWFDEDAEDVLPLPARTLAEREIAAMGGADAVRRLADAATTRDPAWASHLYAKLRRVQQNRDPSLDAAFARSLDALARAATNTNAKSYLLESAWELTHAAAPMPPSELDDPLLAALPISLFFELMPSRLRARSALDVNEAVRFLFTDSGEELFVTVRRGIAEISAAALPSTPAPIASVSTPSLVWKKLATGRINALQAFEQGLRVDGKVAFVRFIDRFEKR